MYMYYLLGYKIMELPISDERKEARAENTYLLALDGDVDFQPEAVIRRGRNDIFRLFSLNVCKAPISFLPGWLT